MQGWSSEVSKDEDQVELLESELHTFEGGDFNLRKGDNGEGRFGEVYQTIHGWGESDIRTVGNPLKRQFGVRDIHFKRLAILLPK